MNSILWTFLSFLTGLWVQLGRLLLRLLLFPYPLRSRRSNDVSQGSSTLFAPLSFFFTLDPKHCLDLTWCEHEGPCLKTGCQKDKRRTLTEKYGGSCRSLAGSMNNGEFDMTDRNEMDRVLCGWSKCHSTVHLCKLANHTSNNHSLEISQNVQMKQ